MNGTSSDNSTISQDYDPTAYVPYWHQRMELATICTVNGLTLLIIVARTTIRITRAKRFKPQDWWMLIAGILLIFPHWACQIGTNRYGSGLHAWNVPDEWLVPFWQFSWGWLGYYLVISLIKVSVCCSLLQILPHHLVMLRNMVYGLCIVILSLGAAEAVVWLFQCQPLSSNFYYSVEPGSCINVDAARYAWIGISVFIDAVILWIPFEIVGRVKLRQYEKKGLYIVFGANLLGTLTCIVGLYAVWNNRASQAFLDLTYGETPYVMCNDVEILMYTIGGSFPVVSQYFISYLARSTTLTTSNSLPSFGGTTTSVVSNKTPGSWRRKTSRLPSDETKCRTEENQHRSESYLANKDESFGTVTELSEFPVEVRLVTVPMTLNESKDT